MSNFTISATRRSRSDPAAVSTAFFAASSHDFVLVPTSSTHLYPASLPFPAIIFSFLLIDRRRAPAVLQYHSPIFGLVKPIFVSSASSFDCSRHSGTCLALRCHVSFH